MYTNKSVMEIEAEKCNSVPTVQEKAEAILAEMNDMLRDRPFVEVLVEKRFNHLNEELHALGWLGLIEKLARKDGKYYSLLKLVDPNSDEARKIM